VLSAAAGYVSGNIGWRALALAAAVGLDVAVFLFAFKVLTAKDLPWKAFLPGATFAAVGWEVLHLIGGAYLSHILKGMSQVYGMFAIVLGALAWIFLQARVVVYAAEINVVRRERLWPRSLKTEPSTDPVPSDPSGRDEGARPTSRTPS